MSANPGIRPTAQVVAVVNKAARRSQVVGILRQEAPKGMLALTPCDPRMPKMMVPVDSLPEDLKTPLQVLFQSSFSLLPKAIVSQAVVATLYNVEQPSGVSGLLKAGHVEHEDGWGHPCDAQRLKAGVPVIRECHEACSCRVVGVGSTGQHDRQAMLFILDLLGCIAVGSTALAHWTLQVVYTAAFGGFAG